MQKQALKPTKKQIYKLKLLFLSKEDSEGKEAGDSSNLSEFSLGLT